MRMYAKLASHSPAPTPARVDARDCGTSFEKVADIKAFGLHSIENGLGGSWEQVRKEQGGLSL